MRRRTRGPATETSAAEVMSSNKGPVLVHAITAFLDVSDYIGCFEKDSVANTTGEIELFNTSSFSTCQCIGYCNFLNLPLAAMGKS